MSTVLDPSTGLPILGQRDPAAEHLSALLAEKQNLGPDDHDWIVLIGYGLTAADAERAAEAEVTGIPASPPIAISGSAIHSTVGPVCARCNEMFVMVAANPCPGMPFIEYLNTLDDDTRAQVIERMAAQPSTQPSTSQASPGTVPT